MLDLDAALCWSPQYSAVELPGERWALLGPSREFVLTAAQLGGLVPEPGGAVVPRALLSAGRPPAENARRLVRLQGLVDAGLLVPAGAIEAGQVTQASRSLDPGGVCAWAERLGWPAATKVFLADHALDGDLPSFDRQCRASGDSWVLVVPYGESPRVGPYFDAREPERPCWVCYATQLRHNQPLRRWLLHHRGELPRGAPPDTSAGEVDAVFRRIAAQGSLFAELTAAPVVFALGGAEQAWIPHPVRRLPQCPGCGSAAAGDGTAHVAERPLVLRSAPARHLDDGGWRVSAPEPTLAGLRAWVSPLTGLFRDCGPLRPQPWGLSVHRVSYGVCPLDRTVVEGASFVDAALGKGMSATQSAASALGEATERLAAHYRGDECILVARPDELPAPAILPGQLVPFSERQYRAFELADSASPDAVLRYREELRLEWTPAWSIGRQALRYVPAGYCYTHAPFDGTRYCRFTSNGGAAGAVVEEAVLQGLFELVERDAVAIWWYNRLERPAIERSASWRADADLVDATIAGQWEWWALDLTHDFELPVAAAVARHRRGGRAAFGFGCHIDARLSLRRALTELCQLIVADDAHEFAFDFDAVAWEPYLLPGRGAPSSRFAAPPSFDRVDLREVILDVVGRAQRRGLDVLVHDYGRPDFPLRTAKVIVPGLNHIWPRLGCRRLYDVPVAMGWLARQKREDELNRTPLRLRSRRAALDDGGRPGSRRRGSWTSRRRGPPWAASPRYVG
ncbi:hypothetical protein BE21_02105 [Sorangium cellulosum]|uniref:YcaO domain-containing protein n=1 Tax=Sorangium cellulosum TaxID=56 RepID=A0A150TTP5_SORCE|nr:hypothetical protein BE21_02105 [Sorangium cellulosum]